MCFQMLVPMGHAFDKTPTYDHKFHIGQYHSYLGGFGTNYLLLQMWKKFKKTFFLLEILCVKEDEESFGIFESILFWK
jgi:hypothetical protein